MKTALLSCKQPAWTRTKRFLPGNGSAERWQILCSFSVTAEFLSDGKMTD